MDKELIELKKQVAEKTGWDLTHMDLTSYLLEKLPKTTNNGDRYLTIIVGETTEVGYTEDSMDDSLWWSYRVEADTPLLALLKLCLALKEAGKI